MRLFDLSRVRLGTGPFARAQELDGDYLRGLDIDRLLAPYRREAGLPAAAPAYGNWESQGLDGHTAGHYLSAVSMMFAATGDAEFGRLARRMVAGLVECQAAGGDGFVGGIPDSASLWAEVRAGSVDATPFSMTGRWVPLYNLHKTLAGLIDAHRHARVEGALEAAAALGDWWIRLTARLTDQKFEQLLDTEFGGMNESFADLADLTGRAEFVRMAHRFAHRALLEPLARRVDALTGLHANTQIPKVIGYQRVAEVSGDTNAAIASRFFWHTVVDHRTVAIGGNSVREHFHPADDFGSMVEHREGPESCNTVNMLRLSGLLFQATGHTDYLEFAERALFNHVLSAQHPGHGGFVYFTSMRPGHYRKYSSHEDSFWCCVGTGLEVHARHGSLIYSHEGRELFVNLFIDSVVDWDAGFTLTQTTRFPFEPATRLTVATAEPTTAAISIRVPGWVSAEPALSLNGERVAADRAGEYLRLDRTWSDGDVLDIALEPVTTIERLPDGSAWGAVVHGPIVLAARVAGEPGEPFIADAGRVSHIARGPLLPLSASPIVDARRPLAELVSGGDELAFSLVTSQGTVPLEPFLGLHDSRYTVYWPLAETGDIDSRAADLAAKDDAALGIDALTIDAVVFGEQQPESDHGFSGEGSERGRDRGIPWRRTTRTMRVELADWSRMGTHLRLETLSDETAVAFDLVVDGRLLVPVRRGAGVERPGVIEVTVPGHPDDRASERLTVEISARDGLGTDRITAVRLLAASTAAPGAS